MPQYVNAYGFIILQIGGGSILFWIIYFFGPREKIDTKDYFLIITSAFFGVALNMLAFFKGLSYTSAIMGAVLIVTTPIFVLILFALIMKEKFSTEKIVIALFLTFSHSLWIFFTPTANQR